MQRYPNAISIIQLRVCLLIGIVNKLISSLDLEGGSCPRSVKGYLSHQHFSEHINAAISHVVIISTDRERKAAFDLGI